MTARLPRMSSLDIGAIAFYFALVLAAGFWYRRKASRNLDAYFLGGRRIHWTALAMSGAVSNFDITGTMWMVSVLYILGMQSWWQHWMWGVALPAFAFAFMARWVRRSNVMTSAEWMVTRFGEDTGARLARFAAAIMAIILTAGVVGYAFQGIGKFAAVYLPLDDVAALLPVGGDWLIEHQAAVLATAVFAITTLYVALGGLYSVVLTDVIQTIILTGAGIVIAVIAFVELSPELIAQRVPEDFTSLAPSWRLEHLAGTEHAGYEMFGLLTIAWIAKGFLMNAGGPGQLYDFQRYLAAANERDAAKLAAAWPVFLIVRWAMVAGIALLALTGVMENQDPEMVMPIVLQEYLPTGLRGLVLAGLLAAFMSTFSSTVNSGASFVVRDIWQTLIRPDANERSLIRCSYLATIGIVLAGLVIGAQATSINQIWSWLMMALSAGVIVPNVLRWYWWRLNGWGYASGVFGGITLSVAALFTPDMPLYWLFLIICLGSLLPSVLVSLLTKPTDSRTLAQFYRTVRPFGFWKPVRQVPGGQDPPVQAEPIGRAILNTVLGIIALTGLYLGPMYLVGHWYAPASLCAAAAAGAVFILYFTWYRKLERSPVEEPERAA